MPDFGVQIRGMQEALAELERLKEGSAELGLKKDRIVSDVVYAAGQNYGRYRNGRLARRAGPTYFFEAGQKAIEDSVVDQLAPALRNGPGAVRSAWAVLIRRGVTASQRQAPVKQGTLRDSIHAAEGGRA